jgi:hypothetical protein
MTENYEKDFVPKNPALALKKLGFDEPCLMAYLGKEKEPYLECDDVRHLQAKDVLNPLKAPTFSQAFRWFREKCLLEGIVEQADDFYWYKFSVYFYGKEGKQKISNGLEFKTYEEAELECLKKLIEIVKQQL